MEGAKIHDERDRNRGLRGAVRALGGAAYSPRAAPKVSTKGHTTGTRARGPTRSCTCAKALTETHPGVRDWLSATRICMQSKLGTPSWPLFRATPHGTASSQSQAADTTRGTFAEARGASQAEIFSQLCGLVPRPASEQAATRRRKRADSPCFAAYFGVASSHSIHQVAPV